MRTMYLIGVLFVINITTFAQMSDVKSNSKIPSLELSGIVNNIKVDEKKSKEWIEIIVSIDVKLTNKGDVPIILLNKDYMLCHGAGTAKTVNELDKMDKKTLTYTDYNISQSAFGVSEEEWTQIKIRLDKDSPPSDITAILPAASSKTINYDLYLHLPLEFIEPFMLKGTLKQWRELSPFYLRLFDCDFRRYGIGSQGNDRLKFAKKLGKKWKNYGYLWLDTIDSEPISLDLSSAVIKSDSQT